MKKTVLFALLLMNWPAAASAADEEIRSLYEINYRWDGQHIDADKWVQQTVDGLNDFGLLELKTPSDVNQFCPKYKELSIDRKKMFWIYLVSAMVELESGFKPNSYYKETFKDSSGTYVVSRGLLQLSLESAKIYDCSVKKGEDLYSSAINLNCGMKILSHWLDRDGRIAGQAGGQWLGAGRYWSIFRHKLPKIKGWTQSIPFCN